MDEINRILLDKGYALVRRGRMLLLVNFESDIAKKYIAEIAELVTPESLDTRGLSDIVKVQLPLGSISPDKAEQELEKLRGPWGQVVVLPSGHLVQITDTVSKLKTIRDYLTAADGPNGIGDVVDIQLKNRSAEEVLQIARPLLGISETATDPPIRIATDLFGTRIYAMGDPSKLKQLSMIVKKVDQPLEGSATGEAAPVEKPELKTYSPGSADPSTVMDVLSTLLAGLPEVRLTTDR